MLTIQGTESPLGAALACAYGLVTFTVDKVDEYSGIVVNNAGAVIGTAHRMPSGNWSVHTQPIAGTFRESELSFV